MNKLEGISGWLLVYIILLIASTIYSLVISINALKEILINNFNIYAFTVFLQKLIIVLLFSFSIYLIIKRKYDAIIWNLFSLWFEYISSLLIFIISLILSLEIRSSPSLLQITIFVLILNLVWPAICTYYFKISKRVKLTLVSR